MYGQTEVTADLYKVNEKFKIVINNAKNVIPKDVETKKPYMKYNFNGVEKMIVIL